MNTLIIMLLIRPGWNFRTKQRPSAYWTRDNKGAIRTKNPPRKISLDLWFHLTLAALWVATGARNSLNHTYAMRDDTSWVGFWIS